MPSQFGVDDNYDFVRKDGPVKPGVERNRRRFRLKKDGVRIPKSKHTPRRDFLKLRLKKFGLARSFDMNTHGQMHLRRTKILGYALAEVSKNLQPSGNAVSLPAARHVIISSLTWNCHNCVAEFGT